MENSPRNPDQSPQVAFSSLNLELAERFGAEDIAQTPAEQLDSARLFARDSTAKPTVTEGLLHDIDQVLNPGLGNLTELTDDLNIVNPKREGIRMKQGAEATEIRSFKDIIADITEAEQPTTESQRWITQKGNVSKKTREVELPVDQTRVDDLYDQLAMAVVSNKEKGESLNEEQILALVERLGALYLNTKNDDGEVDESRTWNLFKKVAELNQVKTTAEQEMDEQEAKLNERSITDDEAYDEGYAMLNDQAENKRSVTDDEAYEQGYKYLEAAKSLEESRNDLATLSIQLRGKHSKKFNEELKQKYNEALKDYNHDYKIASLLAAEMIAEVHDTDIDTVKQAAVWGVILEQRELAKAETTAFDDQNPNMGRLAKWWASKGLAKKAMYGAGATGVTAGVAGAGIAVVSTIATGGVAGLLGGAIALTAKTAKTVGMYKTNKNASMIKSFEGRAEQDRTTLNKLVSSGQVGSAEDISKLVSESLLDTVDSRVNSDIKNNKKRLAIVAGASILGATVGAFAGDYIGDRLHGGSGSGSGGGQTEPTLSGQGTGTPDASGNSTPTTITERTGSSIPASTSPVESTVPTSTSVVESTTPTGPTTTVETSGTGAPTSADHPNAGGTPIETTPTGSSTPVESTIPDTTEPSGAGTPQPDTQPTTPDTVAPDNPEPQLPTPETLDTSTLHVPSGKGFEDSLQQQYGLSDAKAHEAFLAIKPHLDGQANTYMEAGDIRISAPGDMTLNPQAAIALRQFLSTLPETP